MTDLAVDVQILMHGSGVIDEREQHDPCRHLLDVMLDTSDANLVVDNEGLIQAQYHEKLGSSFASQWILRMAERDKLVLVRRARVNRGIQARLNDAGFRISHEDYKLYARTAAGAKSSIVALDDHFYRVRRLLQEMGVADVLPPPDACDLLTV